MSNRDKIQDKTTSYFPQDTVTTDLAPQLAKADRDRPGKTKNNKLIYEIC